MFRTEPTQFPNSVLIETFNKCHGGCEFCPYRVLRKDEKPHLMPMEVIKKLLDEISNYDNVKRITLFNNNEPLLDKRIYEVVAYTKQTNPNVESTLSTNGRLYTPQVGRKLYDAGLTTLYISIPSLEKNSYKKLMDFEVAGILKAIMDTDEEVRKNMIRIAVPKTYAYNEKDFIEFFGKLGTKICSWNLEYRESWNCFDFKKLSENVEIKKYKPCDRPMDQAVILSNGNMVICCRDWEEKTVVGNVYNSTIKEVWQGEKMKAIQTKIANKDYNSVCVCCDCSEGANY
ncbi:MAG: radical SAM protein [Clostridiales bacterium]|nr:radical SAM protein [Clostridiales bacterium]